MEQISSNLEQICSNWKMLVTDSVINGKTESPAKNDFTCHMPPPPPTRFNFIARKTTDQNSNCQASRRQSKKQQSTIEDPKRKELRIVTSEGSVCEKNVSRVLERLVQSKPQRTEELVTNHKLIVVSLFRHDPVVFLLLL